MEWLKYSRTQVDKHNGTTISHDRFWKVTRWPHDLRGQRVLEAGSGSGRYTQVLLGSGATTVSFDFSAAVLANLQNNGGAPNLTLFRGDIYNIPFAEGSFDRVVCIGVIQHTPHRGRAFRNLARMLRPGGEIVADVYRLGLGCLLHPKYYLRPLRRLVPRDRLLEAVRVAVPLLLPLKGALRRIPLVGVPLGHMLVPVPDFRNRLPLSPRQCIEWSELDLFDWISPEHDRPSTRWEVERWCRDAGLEDVSVVLDSKGWQYTIRGRRPAR
jgi:SAM-dependent methyltransferase